MIKKKPPKKSPRGLYQEVQDRCKALTGGKKREELFWGRENSGGREEWGHHRDNAWVGGEEI